MGVFEGQFNHMTMATGINSEWPFYYLSGYLKNSHFSQSEYSRMMQEDKLQNLDFDLCF